MTDPELYSNSEQSKFSSQVCRAVQFFIRLAIVFNKVATRILLLDEVMVERQNVILSLVV